MKVRVYHNKGYSDVEVTKADADALPKSDNTDREKLVAAAYLKVAADTTLRVITQEVMEE